MDIGSDHLVPCHVTHLLCGEGCASVYAALFCGNLVHGTFRVLCHGLARHTNERRCRSISLKAAPASTGARLTVSYDHHVA